MAPNQQPIKVVSENTTTEQKAYLWKIPYFAEMFKSSQVLDSQQFSFEIGNEIGLPTVWKCCLGTEESEGEIDEIGFYAKLMDYPDNLTELHANVRIQIKGHNTNTYFVDWNYNHNMVNSGEGENWGFPDVLDPKTAKGDLPLQEDGSLEILVTVTIFNLNDNKPSTQLTELMSRKEQKETGQSQVATIMGEPLEGQ